MKNQKLEDAIDCAIEDMDARRTLFSRFGDLTTDDASILASG